jgi:hypothetical protein
MGKNPLIWPEFLVYWADRERKRGYRSWWHLLNPLSEPSLVRAVREWQRSQK